MGLLDQVFASNTEDPRYASNMALFGNMVNGNFGGGLLAASQAGGQARQQQQEMQLRAMQMQDMQSQIAQREAAMRRAEEESKFGQALFNGGMPGGSASPSPMPGTQTGGGMPSPQAQVQALASPAGRSWLSTLNEDQVAGLIKMGKLPAGTEKLWEIAKFGKDYKQGDFRIMSDGSQSMVPMVKEGLGYGPGGVSVLPGAAQSQQQLTLANELAKAAAASAGRVNLRANADGTQSPVPELSENTILQNYLGGMSGGPAGPRPMPPQQQMQPMQPRLQPPAQAPAFAPQAGVKGAFAGDPEQVAAGIAAIRDPQERANAQAAFDSQMRQTSGQLGPYGKTTEQAAREKLTADAGGEINTSWIKTSYEPTLTAGQSARDIADTVRVTRQAMDNLGKTGWSTQAQAAGAAVLSGLGIAPQNAKLFAANAEVFQAKAMERVNVELNAAKGPQTDQDAIRAQQTFASLKNTPQANKFILDMAEAKAMRDQMKARFYQEAMPIAKQKGDLSEVDREWSRRAPSIFTLPPMQPWGGGIK